MALLTKRRPLDLILPGVLLLAIPLDLLAGLVKGSYPTQATPLSLLSALLGLYLANTLRHLPATRIPSEAELDMPPEDREVDYANARVNRVLGMALIFFGFCGNIFWWLSILAAKTPRVPGQNGTTTGYLVEAGIIALFTFLVVVIEFAGLKIYSLGRKLG
jgi:hypothetical protein